MAPYASSETPPSASSTAATARVPWSLRHIPDKDIMAAAPLMQDMITNERRTAFVETHSGVGALQRESLFSLPDEIDGATLADGMAAWDRIEETLRSAESDAEKAGLLRDIFEEKSVLTILLVRRAGMSAGGTAAHDAPSFPGSIVDECTLPGWLGTVKGVITQTEAASSTHQTFSADRVLPLDETTRQVAHGRLVSAVDEVNAARAACRVDGLDGNQLGSAFAKLRAAKDALDVALEAVMVAFPELSRRPEVM